MPRPSLTQESGHVAAGIPGTPPGPVKKMRTRHQLHRAIMGLRLNMYKMQKHRAWPAVTLNGFPSPRGFKWEAFSIYMCEIEEEETRYGTKKDRKSLKMGENSDTRRWDKIWLWKRLESSSLERIEEFSS